MSCCGQKRDAWQAPGRHPDAASNNQDNTSRMFQDVIFEYTGMSGLSVSGNVTGKKYRFNGNGDRQLIDYRDASGMVSVPVLKKIS